ncbi:hypothetical protein V9654_001786 [Vibrio parahaemolyticus]|uniref:hypothetical protein n=1 Tax=Vibrio parahaemolyticus TaxID=670 RepID=UPI0006B285A2|nr:hypothetical protein [Vibrio parahaemolyticus]EGQ8300511.1 hypothetical protein [Vibrio parahaemolyticus]EGR1549785.1 hypothetical protein [Vibrio parahaemolyticus]EGR2220140.1 hypothetical protein [Vibrio parahaemolyticus]EGR2781521.1 hypothetical protein [Vibrio parahaemolyticus]EGR3035942.1 hypothetical protein [Vibrio parahaemolyticus]
MKKLILAAAVSGVLVGCGSDDVEKALSTELSSFEARNAAEDILEATSLLVKDILAKCNITASTDTCSQSYDPDALDDFDGNEAGLKITTSNSVIMLTSNDSGKYFEYSPFLEKLRISYSSEGDLDHYLKIDISNYPSIKVDFDAHNINDDGNFGSSAETLDYDFNGTNQLSGKISVSKDDFTCSDNDC